MRNYNEFVKIAYTVNGGRVILDNNEWSKRDLTKGENAVRILKDGAAKFGKGAKIFGRAALDAVKSDEALRGFETGCVVAGGLIAHNRIRASMARKKRKKKEESLKKTAFEELDEMMKMAKYLKDINCEQCGYKGEPDPDGTCPECGAIGGHKAEGLQKKHEPTLEEIENSKNTADDDFREEQENLRSMIIGG